MNQSSAIGFGLVAGFIVYITVRGELPAYLCVVGFGNNCPPIPADPVPQQQTTPPTNSTIKPPANSGGVITTPPWGGGGGGPDLTLPPAPGWNFPSFPIPTFPTIPTTGTSSSTFFCYDSYGNLVNCDALEGGESATCFDENGQAVSCD